MERARVLSWFMLVVWASWLTAAQGVLAAPANASALTMSAVVNAHIDMAWLWPVRETVRKCVRTYANVAALADDYPELIFASSQAQHLAWLAEAAPAKARMASPFHATITFSSRNGASRSARRRRSASRARVIRGSSSPSPTPSARARAASPCGRWRMLRPSKLPRGVTS